MLNVEVYIEKVDKGYIIRSSVIPMTMIATSLEEVIELLKQLLK